MSRYQGRHRTKTPQVWRNARVAVPAAAAATLTLTAAGVAQATGNAAPVKAELTLSKPHATTAFDRLEERTTSRSQSRAVAGNKTTAAADRAAAQRALTAKTAAAKTAAAKTAAAKTAAQRKAALDAMAKATPAAELKVATPTAKAPAAAAAPASGGSSAKVASASGWVFPIAGGGTFTSGFGHRSSPGGIGSTNHMGDDFATPIGTPLRAMKSGTITKVGWYGGQGMRVEIDFGGGVSAVYAHMSAFKVSEGEQVGQGEIVGYSGNTGNSTGAHLHLEIHLGGTPIDPAPWLQARGIF